MAEQKSVLIVEDDPEMRDLITLMLQPDFRISGQARDGSEAVRLAAGRHPDVIVLDYVMPYMDGAEAGALIRSENPDIKILVFSAFEGTQQAVSDAWADSYLSKSRVADLPLAVARLADQHA